MAQTPILPDVGSPVSTNILNKNELKTASLGELIYALTMLTRVVMARISSPTTFYDEIAVFHESSGADWSGLQGDLPSDEGQHPADEGTDQSQAPIIKVTPPDNYCDTIPGLGYMLRQIDRGFDGIMTHYARHVERGLTQSTTYMGSPFAQKPHRNSQQYFTEVMQFSGYRANKLVDRATCLTFAHGQDPELATSQPKFPLLADALTEGRLSGENANRIVDLDKGLTEYARKVGKSTQYKDLVLQAFEPTLVEAAESSNPDTFSKAKQRWMDRIAHEIDPDGPSPSEALRKQADNAIKTQNKGDGSGVISMHATPSVFAAFKTLMIHQRNWDGKSPFIPEDIAAFLYVDSDPTDIDEEEPAAEPDQNRQDTEFDPDEVVGEDDHGNPVTAGYMQHIDAMTEGQKFGAYFVGALRMILSMDPTEAAVKRSHGTHAQLVMVQDIQTAHKMLGLPPLPPEVRRPSGPDGIIPPIIQRTEPDPSDTQDPNAYVNSVPWTDFQSEAINVGPLHPKDAEPLGCDCEIVGQIWNGPDTVLHQKRAHRLFTPTQRRAILARDRGCQAPGCTVPAALCDVHHIIDWLYDGDTDEDNAMTLCTTHHAAVHNDKWTIRKVDGLFFFQPALWLDPSRPLLRNLYWKV